MLYWWHLFFEPPRKYWWKAKYSSTAMHRPALKRYVQLLHVGHFRLYDAFVDDQHQAICLESDCYPGAYVSWDTDSKSIRLFVSLNSVYCLQ